MSTETIRTIWDGEPRTATSNFTQLLSVVRYFFYSSPGIFAFRCPLSLPSGPTPGRKRGGGGRGVDLNQIGMVSRRAVVGGGYPCRVCGRGKTQVATHEPSHDLFLSPPGYYAVRDTAACSFLPGPPARVIISKRR